MPGTKRNDCHRNNHQHQFFPAGKGKTTNLSATPTRRQQELQEKTLQEKNIFVREPEHVESCSPIIVTGQFFKIDKAPQQDPIHIVPIEEKLHRFSLVLDKLDHLQQQNKSLFEREKVKPQPTQINASERLVYDEDSESESNGLSLSM